MSTAIRAENISKEYRLGAINHGVLFRDLQAAWARARGKEDPNARLFDSQRSVAGKFLALKDVSFEIEKGDVIGIVGRNGAGKSTLLKILSRVTPPTFGKISIHGKIASLLEVGTGFHPELSGRENIFLNGAILGMSRKQILAKLEEIIEFSGVAEHIDTPVKRYSSGMYVRLAFAVAAHLESDILIVDEVLAVGDAEFQKKCLGKMSDISKGEGRTVLFVSHNMASIRSLCPRSILLVDGKLSAIGPSYDIIQSYLTSLQDQTIDDFKINKDYSNRRGTGEAVFVSIEGFNKIYDFDDAVLLDFKFDRRKFRGTIYIKVLFKHPETNEILFSTNPQEINHPNSCQIRILPKYILPGSYRTYVWLGTETGEGLDLLEDVFELKVTTRKGFAELGFDPFAPGYFVHVPSELHYTQ